MMDSSTFFMEHAFTENESGNASYNFIHKTNTRVREFAELFRGCQQKSKKYPPFARQPTGARLPDATDYW